MTNGKYTIFNAVNDFYNALEKEAHNSRARAGEKRAIAAEERAIRNEALTQQRLAEEHQARQKARRMQEEYFNNPQASDVLGKGRLGTSEDAAFEDMHNPSGLYLGGLEGRPIFYNGDAHLLNYGLTRSGKGTTIVLPNLAHVFNRSVVVNDIKDGENAYATAGYRKHRGHRIIQLNPYNLLGAGSYKLNPFQRIINHASIGLSVSEDCLQLCFSIVPPKKDDKDGWVVSGAAKLLATWLEWSAIFRPDRCTLADMWRFVFKNFQEESELIRNCGNEGLEGQMEMFYQFEDAQNQFIAYQSEIVDNLWVFRPGEPLAEVTSKTNFDPASMCHELTTVYLMARSDVLEAAQKWMALTISSIVNTCAQETGKHRVLFMIDELANLPYMAIIPKALTLYAGKGVQLWGLCQGRSSLRDRGYSDNTIRNFETQSGVLHCWNVKEPDLLKDIETWSGNMAVATKGMNVTGGAVESGGFSVSEQKRPVLQSEDILAIGDGKQILRTNGANLYVADRVPWFEVPGWKDKLRDVRSMPSATSSAQQRIQTLAQPQRRLPHLKD